MGTWQISDFQRFDKSICIDGPLHMEVDYDDVDHDAVDVLLPVLVETLNRNFESPEVYACPNYNDYDDYPEHDGEQHYFLDPGECPQCHCTLEVTVVEES